MASEWRPWFSIAIACSHCKVREPCRNHMASHCAVLPRQFTTWPGRAVAGRKIEGGNKAGEPILARPTLIGPINGGQRPAPPVPGAGLSLLPMDGLGAGRGG